MIGKITAKGVTPIVSVVLLLLMTIALAGGVMVYLTGYTSGLQSDVVVKDPFCNRINSTHVTFRVRVQNIASTGSIDDVTLTVLSGPDTDIQITDPDLSGTNAVSPGQQKLIDFEGNKSGGLDLGTYVIDVATDRGAARGTFSCP